MGTFVVILFICALGWAIKKGIETNRLQKAENDTFLTKHEGWDVFVSAFDRRVLAINHDSRRIILGTVTTYGEHPWASIASVEVLRDGGSITSTNRGSQVAGAAVGGILLGGVGLLVGGLSGSKSNKQTVNEISLKIIVDDRSAPVHIIPFVRMPGKGVDPRHVMVKQMVVKLDHFHALLVNAVRSSQLAAPAPQAALPSRGDQLSQLWSLKQSGALTDEEFAAEKANLLSDGRLQSS